MIIIMILCAFRFYSYYQLDNNIQKLPGMLLVPFLMIITWRQLVLKEKDPLYKGMRLLLISWILSMLMSYIFWNQSFTLSYRTSVQSMFLVIFFYFCKKKVTRKALEKLIVLFGWLYIILWIYAMMRAPEVTFGVTDDDLNDQRGMFRINFVGRLSLIFAYFYYLNKCFIERNPKYKVFAVIFFIFIIFQLTRQLILWAGVVTIISIFLRAKKLATMLGVLFFALYIGSVNINFSDDSVIGSMINLTNTQIDNNQYSGTEDIRVTEYKYFFGEWSPNLITNVFGNGMPHTDSSYGHYYTNLQSEGLYLSDVGYPSMFVLLGLFGLILYLWLFIKCTMEKLPKELSYVNMFMGFMIPANIAASWYMGADTQLAMCICVYIIYTYHKRPQLLNLKKDEI